MSGNNCEHVLPGGCGCKSEIKKGNCAIMNHKKPNCTGRTGAAGANVETGMAFIESYKKETSEAAGPVDFSVN